MARFAFARAAMPVLILAALTAAAAGATTREDRGHSLRHTEQSAVVVSDSVKGEAEANAQTEIQETMLVGSMGSMLQDEKEVMDPKSPKAALQRKLVALIWLERVLEQNLNSMDTEAFRKTVAKSKTGLEKDSTPATADMLGNMRTEMHEFSVPFFKDAVQNELTDIRARQKVLLDQIIAVESGEPMPVEIQSDDITIEKEEKEEKGEKKKKKKPTTAKKEKASPKKGSDDDPEVKKQRNKQSNIFVFLMSLLGATLILIVLGIAIKVHTHVPRAT